MFALSLVAAPVLTALMGLSGLFVLTGVLALTGVAVVIWPAAEPARHVNVVRGKLSDVLRDAHAAPELRCLCCNAVLLAMWVAVPAMLVDAGCPRPTIGGCTCRRCLPLSS